MLIYLLGYSSRNKFGDLANVEYWSIVLESVSRPGAGFTKGLKSRICLKSKIKVLNVKNFVIKLRHNLCLDKMGFMKGLR